MNKRLTDELSVRIRSNHGILAPSKRRSTMVYNILRLTPEVVLISVRNFQESIIAKPNDAVQKDTKNVSWTSPSQLMKVITMMAMIMIMVTMVDDNDDGDGDNVNVDDDNEDGDDDDDDGYDYDFRGNFQVPYSKLTEGGFHPSYL